MPDHVCNRNNSESQQQPHTSGAQRTGAQQQPSAQPIAAEKLPSDYVDKAEEVMLSLMNLTGGRTKFDITVTKIRKMLTLITEILNDERLNKNAELKPQNVQRLQMARVRIAYDAGRDSDVKKFVEKAKLLNYIKGIQNRAEFLKFAEYMEALVAWHRYLGGEN
ncbi:MAG: type III-A CRISPR-associated protein Csm2 [Cloacibacillus sp.]